ncbi:MAG: cyclophilin-like fold protein [bacterium]
MPRRVRVVLGGVAAVAELFEEAAPKTVDAVWSALPIDGTLNHANFSGEEISFPTYGLLWERENQLSQVQPGDLGYFVEGPALVIYYGAVRVISPGNVFGRIVENLTEIQKVGRACWKEPRIPARLERLEETADGHR